MIETTAPETLGTVDYGPYCTNIATGLGRRLDLFTPRSFRIRHSQLPDDAFPPEYEVPFALGHGERWPQVDCTIQMESSCLVVQTALLRIRVFFESDEFEVHTLDGASIYPSEGKPRGLFCDGYALFDSASAHGEQNENSRYAHWFYSRAADCYHQVALKEDVLLDRFFIYGPGYSEVFQAFRDLCGAAPVPPRRAFGYMQTQHLTCRGTQSKLLALATRLRAEAVPCDTLIVDFEWGDGCRAEGQEITWGEGLDWSEAYARPNTPSDMLEELTKLNFQVLLIHHSAPQFGSRWNQGWTQKEYPPKVWWKALEEKLNQGVRGTWQDTRRNDITNDVIQRGLQERHGDSQRALMITNYDMQDIICWNRKSYPAAFANCIGTHRYPIHWTGDCDFTWQELRWQVQAITGDQGAMKAIPYLNSDTIGRNWKLLIRWRQFTALCPIARSHSTKPWNDGEAGNEEWLADFEKSFAWGTRDPLTPDEEARSAEAHQETPIDWSQSPLDAVRKAHELRYELLPHIYGLALENHRTGMPLVRPLYVEFPDDPEATHHPLQYMLGSSLLVAPVCRDTDVWRIYLPTGCDFYDYSTGRKYRGGTSIDFDCGDLATIPLFVREGCIIVTMPRAQWIEASTGRKEIILRLYGLGEQTSTLVEDDGESLAYQRGQVSRTRFSFSPAAGTLSVGPVGGSDALLPEKRRLTVTWRGISRPPVISGCRVHWNAEAQVAFFEAEISTAVGASWDVALN